MKHPFYKRIDNEYIDYLSAINTEELEDMLEKTDENEDKLMMSHFFVHKIKSCGLPHIQVDDSSWKSNVSRDTLKSIDYKYFKLPFDFFTVIVNDDLYCIANFNIIKKEYLNFLSDSNKVLDNGFLAIKIHTGDKIGGIYVLNQEDFAYCIDTDGEDLFSLILYTSTFKNDRSRVSKLSTIKSKKSKNTPKHSYSIIRLTQPISSKQGYSTERCKSEKMWIVRGHWRKQPYKDEVKPKWIDSYWKGNGKNRVQSIYIV